jgi:phosphopantetheinyl transferase (holo-ACP synthase)
LKFEAQGPRYLLLAGDGQVVEAGMRSLKMVYHNQLAPRERIFEPEALQRLIALMGEPGKVTAEVAARILERCCRSTEQQHAVVAAQALGRLVPMLSAPRWSAREAALQALVAIIRDNPSNCELLVQSSPRILEETLSTPLLTPNLS